VKKIEISVNCNLCSFEDSENCWKLKTIRSRWFSESPLQSQIKANSINRTRNLLRNSNRNVSRLLYAFDPRSRKVDRDLLCHDKLATSPLYLPTKNGKATSPLSQERKTREGYQALPLYSAWHCFVLRLDEGIIRLNCYGACCLIKVPLFSYDCCEKRKLWVLFHFDILGAVRWEFHTISQLMMQLTMLSKIWMQLAVKMSFYLSWDKLNSISLPPEHPEATLSFILGRVSHHNI
jgi:hypothetical protein